MTGYVDAQTSPQCKKRKLKATTNIESLPDDIIFEILVRVSAEDIYDSTRLVCRKWYTMTQTRNFVHSHLQRSIPGLLSVWKYATPPLCVRLFMTIQNGRTEISLLSYGKVLSSCNGLLLERSENFEEPNIANPTYITNPPYITNPVTNQCFALPPLPPPIVSDEVIYNDSFAIAYAASSGAYKVVRVSHSNHNKLRCISIMTVGVDTDWGRRVNTQHLSDTAKMLLTESPLTTQGFVHWARYGYSDCVLTMNIRSETITQIPGPRLCLDDGISWYCYLPMGSYLSLLIGHRSLWEAWKMKPETGEWTKMPSIDIPQKMSESVSFELERSVFSDLLRPVGWSNSQEVLFFYVHYVSPQVIASYNVRTRELGSFYQIRSIENLFVEHRSSLVWLD